MPLTYLFNRRNQMFNDGAVWPYGVELKPGEKFIAIPFDVTLAGNASTLITYQLPNGYDFVLSMVNAYASQVEGFSFNIKDGGTYEYLFTSQIKSSLITGNGQNPFLMPKQHRFKNGRTVEINITNLSANQNVIELALIGHRSSQDDIVAVSKTGKMGTVSPGMKIPEGTALYKIERLFVLPFNLTIASGATVTDKYPISNEFDFIWEILNVYHDAVAPREFTLQIRDELLTEDLFVSPVRASLVAGNGQKPFILPRPYIFRGGTHLKVTLTDTDTGADIHSQIAFFGYKAKKIQ